MAALLKWKEPSAATKWEYEHEVVPEFRKFFWLCGKWTLLLGVPFLLALWHWAPEHLRQAWWRVVMCGILLPGCSVFLFWLESKIGVRHTVTKRGIAKASTSNRFFSWKQIEAYRFEDHPAVPGVRVLALKLRFGRKTFPRNLPFSPQEVSERALSDLLRQYLPPRPWSQD